MGVQVSSAQRLGARGFSAEPNGHLPDVSKLSLGWIGQPNKNCFFPALLTPSQFKKMPPDTSTCSFIVGIMKGMILYIRITMYLEVCT
jgi:hypothetical protein